MIVIFKAKKKFPDTGEILESSQWKEGGWIEKKSRGRLTIPADNFLEKIKKWENKFLSFHGESIHMEPEPIERLVKKILENEIKSPFTIYIVNCFVKTRFFHRIKFLNSKSKKEKVRTLKQKAQFVC